MKRRINTEKRMKAYLTYRRNLNGTYSRTSIGTLWASSLGAARSLAQTWLHHEARYSENPRPFAVVLPKDRPEIHPDVTDCISRVTESTYYVWPSQKAHELQTDRLSIRLKSKEKTMSLSNALGMGSSFRERTMKRLGLT